jgi:hypothetical protein
MNATRIYSDDPGPENEFTIGYAVDVDRPTREANAKLFAASAEMAKMLLTLQSIDGYVYVNPSELTALLKKAGYCEVPSIHPRQPRILLT